MPTASEIAQVSGNPFASDLLVAVQDQSPIFNSLLALPMIGTSFLTLALTGLPSPNGVLDINQGYVAGKVSLEMSKVESKRFGIMIQAPKSSTDLWNQQNTLASGANIGTDYMTLQARGVLAAELRNMDRLIIYGSTVDAKSFPGLKEITAATTANTLLRDGGFAPEVGEWFKSSINWTGTTANTASSVYSVCEGETDVSLRIGGPRGIEGFLDMSEITEQYFVDPGDANRKQKYYITDGEGYAGLAVFGSSQPNREFGQYSVRRLYNITADSGKTLTQKAMDQLIESHPPGHKPTKFYMSARSLRQLRDDIAATRTVFVDAGSAARNGLNITQPELAPSYANIPIIVSDAILSTDAIEVPA